MIKVDVRILAATNINIPEALASPRVRDEVSYRLNAVTLQLPPRRDRVWMLRRNRGPIEATKRNCAVNSSRHRVRLAIKDERPAQ